MPFCSQCGNENPENAVFCGNCGQSVNAVAASKITPATPAISAKDALNKAAPIFSAIGSFLSDDDDDTDEEEIEEEEEEVEEDVEEESEEETEEDEGENKEETTEEDKNESKEDATEKEDEEENIKEDKINIAKIASLAKSGAGLVSAVKSSMEKEEEDVIFCTNCGAKLPKEMAFCGNCGSSTKPIAQEVKQETKIPEPPALTPMPEPKTIITEPKAERSSPPIPIIIGAIIAVIGIALGVYFFSKDSTETSELSQKKDKSITPIEITNQDMYYIPVRDDNGFHKYITLDGKSITEAKYLRAYVFKNGIALVQEKDSSWGYIDTKGNYIANGYTQGLSFNNGIAWVNASGVIKAINADGNILASLPQEIISVWPFYDDRALFSANGMQNYLDKNFNAVSNEYYADGNRFQENMASVMCNNGKYRYIDKTMRGITKCLFDEAKVFKNSKAVVRVGNGWGIIDKQGKYILQPSNDIEAIIYDDDMFRYKKKDANWGWLDSDGQVVIQPNFAETMSFGDRDITPVRQDALWGYIDKKGEYIINLQYKVAYPFINNRAFVKFEDGYFATIDINGKKDLQTKYQKFDNSYWEMINSGVTSESRIMTVKPKSFNCDKPNNNEKTVARMICKSFELIKDDNYIAEEYTMEGYKNFSAERNKCKDINCLYLIYESRRIEIAETEEGI